MTIITSRDNWPLRYFSPDEVADTETGEVKLYLPFGQKMDALRKVYGAPIHVTSWYRTPDHDRRIGGKGNHTGGWAADVLVSDRYRLLKHAFEMGFYGIGVHRNFVHLDMNETYNDAGKRPACWGY